MRAISLFSGVGGLDLGLSRAGIETVLQAEIDPWCRAVLERHFPAVERMSDVRDVSAHLAGASRWIGDGGRDGTGYSVDLVHGGFPCQDVSVAGRRAGFRGERSGLWSEFYRVLSELRPPWTLIENVPGLLSSHSGRDFGTILSGLVDLGYGVAWRTLDAQHFGVPQRRRRVFIVGCLGDENRAAAVLAVCEGCGGDPAASGEAGEDVAGAIAAGAYPSGFNGQDADNGHLVANAVRASDGHHGHSSPRGDGADNLIAAPLTAGDHPNSNMPGRHHEDDEVLVVADPISASEGKTWSHEGSHNFRLHNVVNGVRRLTPLECERLMGWPDEWTRWTADGREVPDSVRYRQCGNGVVATVAEWLGWRIRAVDGGLDGVMDRAYFADPP